jgi:general secretion pathway protein K
MSRTAHQRISIRRSEQGAALLTVLLLVAILSVIAALMLERASLATNLAINSADRNVARWSGFGLEAISVQRITALRQEGGRLPPISEGNDALSWDVPLDNSSGQSGAGRITARDGGTCFNVNGLVSGQKGSFTVRPLGIEQFARLANILEIDQRQARSIGESIADWIDSDQQPEPGGAEDAFYLRQPEPHRTGGQLIHDVGELREVRGMTDDIFAVLQPWLCALPIAELSSYNINQMKPEDYPLLASLLFEDYPALQMESVLRRRPPLGFPSVIAFWQMVNQNQNSVDPQVEGQAVINTRWYDLEMAVQVGNAVFTERALVDSAPQPAQLVRRIWDASGAPQRERNPVNTQGQE